MNETVMCELEAYMVDARTAVDRAVEALGRGDTDGARLHLWFAEQAAEQISRQCNVEINALYEPSDGVF